MAPTPAAERLRGRRVLITGGLGFIGGSLARALVEADADVLIVDALLPECGGTYANIAGVEDAVTVVELDLREQERLHELLEGREHIFNLAGHTSHMDSMTAPQLDLQLNCRAQLSLLEGCRHLRPAPTIVFAGTRQIYGRPRYLPVDEAHPIDPVDINGIHKVTAEQYHLLYGRLYDIPVVVLRLTNTYGPGMRVRDARQTFLGVWLQSLIRNTEFEIWGDGSQVRDFTYVDDAVEAFLLAAAEPAARGAVLNLGGERPVTLRELADLLVAANGRGSYRIIPYPDDRKPIDIGDYVGDYTAIRELLGWRPTVSLEDGLNRSLDYFRAHGERYW
jgi:UDP-glucose 4-epimerase